MLDYDFNEIMISFSAFFLPLFSGFFFFVFFFFLFVAAMSINKRVHVCETLTCDVYHTQSPALPERKRKERKQTACHFLKNSFHHCQYTQKRQTPHTYSNTDQGMSHTLA